MSDNQAGSKDTGQGRIQAMDAAGSNASVLSVVTPPPSPPGRRRRRAGPGANDEAADAVRRTRSASARSRPCRPATRRPPPRNSSGAPPGWVSSRDGPRADRPRPLDDPAYDDLLATAARLRQPSSSNPQIPSNELRDAAYRGLGPADRPRPGDLRWGWHNGRGLSALRLILRGHVRPPPDLQLVLGPLGECCCSGRTAPQPVRRRQAPSAAGFRLHHDQHPHHQQRMLQERLLRHTLDFTSADQVLFSTDYPPPAQRSRGQAVLRRHPRPRGPHQGRLRQPESPVPPDLTGPAPANPPPSIADGSEPAGGATGRLASRKRAVMMMGAMTGPHLHSVQKRR